MNERERRAFTGAVEIRDKDGKGKIRGYAAVFNSPADIMGLFEEEIAPGAFDRALEEKHDVRCLLNHNPDLLLGRTESGTLDLGVDEHGLWYEDDPPETSAGQDAVESIRRGDMSGSSFGFIIRGFEWKEEEGKPDKRIISDVDLFDVSPCTFPAYDDTEVAVRQWRDMKQTRDGEEQQLRQDENWKAIPFSRHGSSTKQDEEADWDAGAEVAAADVDQLKKMCLFEDTENLDIKGGYKGPHHTADGNKVNWHGVAAAMGVLRGARGGFKGVTDEEKSKGYAHLKSHYDQFDKEAPENPYRSEDLTNDTLTSGREARARQARLRANAL